MSKHELGNQIAAARKAQGVSIRKLAALAGTSTRAVQAVEKGWYNVGIDIYLAIADVLGMKMVCE